MLEFAGPKESKKSTREISLTPNARVVLTKRYLRRGPDGQPVETVEGMFARISHAVAEPDQVFDSFDETEEKFYDLLTTLRFFPNSPTFTGAGTPLGQLAACFVLPITDDMGRDQSGIFQTLRNAALIQQTGGGNGFSFSRLRPKGDYVATSAGTATGPVGFLRVYDKAFGEIAQGGSRRGANMGVLRVDHPDIMDFIKSKAEEGQITNFNISVALTDKFMQAVKDDTTFDLVNPRDGKVWKTMRAREIFDEVVKYAHHNGEPGCLFIDEANRTNPVPHLYDLESTNPCGEQWLGPYENCCLGSINLAQHILEEDGVRKVDWVKLQRSVEEATHFLDNVVSANKYVPAVPQLQESAHRARRIGLGIMGLGDLMYALGVRYGGRDGEDFAGQVMEFVRFHCMRTSIELAEQRGPFPAIHGSIYDPDNLKWQPPTPLQPYSHNWGRPALDWKAIVAGIKRHGIRNAAQTTIAPTGTIATVAGCEGYGCEPVFALAYIRHVKDPNGGPDIDLTYASPLFERALSEVGVDEAARQKIYDRVMETGTCQGIAEVPAAIRRSFVVAGDITPEEHVRMQAAMQRFVDNSLSKCVIGDTLVLTAQGLTPIAELSQMRLDDQFEPLTIDVMTPTGVEKTDAFFYGGMRETRRVRLAYGYEIEGTPNHRVYTLREDGTIAFACLDELKIGDTIVLYGGQQVFGPTRQPLPAYTERLDGRSKGLVFPTHMSADLAYVLGCITSEGAISRNGVTITNGDRTLLERLALLAQHLFGVKGHIFQDTRRDSLYTLQINSRPLRNWLLTGLMMEAGARNKVIPTVILRASRPEIAAFLRGLFLDAYMTLDGRMFGIGLASRKLIRQLQVLLLNFGVVSAVHRAAHAWVLTVSGAALDQLAAFVEFEEVWKSERIAVRHEGRQHRLYNYIDLMPAALTQSLRAMQEASTHSLLSLYGEPTAEYQRARVNLLQGHRFDRSLAEKLHHHFGDAPDTYAKRFFASDQPGLIYLDVRAIETGFAEVFDLSLPGSHTFVANGLGNHNTCNFPEGATVEDVAKVYMLAWELGCKGLTVYVTGSRDQVVLETKQTLEAKQQPKLPVVVPKPRERQSVLVGRTYRMETPIGTAYVTINDCDGEPYEVFINVGKGGSDVAAVSEALGRLCSLELQTPSPLSARERAKEIVHKLRGISGSNAIGFGPNRVSSLPDAIAVALQRHIGAEYDGGTQLELTAEISEASEQAPTHANGHGKAVQRDLCPECGQATLLHEEGCRTCLSCGYSKC